jgi:hypothetical protein
MLKLKKGDLLIIAAVLLAAAVLLGLKHLPVADGGKTLRIELEGQLIDEVDFTSDVDRQIAVQLPEGQAIVEISGGKVRVVPMPKDLCPLGICSSVGWVEQSGDAIVCLPNRMVLTVVGGPSNELWDSLDGVTR